MIATLPCNPSIGGPAKGIVVREIDALGGEMGKNTDKSHIQMRMLNISKGPAVRALRAQVDKVVYPKTMQQTLFEQEHLEVKEGYVASLLTDGVQCSGVTLEDGTIFESLATIITTGTFMEAKILVGDQVTISGPDDQKASVGLSKQLRELGFVTKRLKTGTPQRVKRSSIDFSKTEIHPGDDVERAFSYSTTSFLPIEEQEPCYLTYTNALTHEIILENLTKSSMYSGVVEGVGPRYCPSIEDKLVRFKDKLRHQIFLEPESKLYDEIYVQGFSTSMPHDIQEKMIRTLPGLEHCEIVKYAYAIEYDAIDSRDLWPTLESKIISNLYFAGQVNGTSGYEEAACQGLMAGINAVLKLNDQDPFVLRRDEAYIGVLIDDLVTKGTNDPYRLLTSRAEYRLLLRHDNADIRLLKYGYNIGLVNEETHSAFEYKLTCIDNEKSRLSNIFITPTNEINQKLSALGSTNLREKSSLKTMLKRPELNYEKVLSLIDEVPIIDKEVFEQVEIDTKYEGYITKAIKQAKKLLKVDDYAIPTTIDYHTIPNLAKEAKEKLSKIRPLSIGQASRISGVNPADISILLIYIKSMTK